MKSISLVINRICFEFIIKFSFLNCPIYEQDWLMKDARFSLALSIEDVTLLRAQKSVTSLMGNVFTVLKITWQI